MPYKVLIPQDISGGGKNYLLERGYEIVIGDGPRIDLETVSEYDAILLRTAVVDSRVIDAAERLRVIGRYGAEVDNIDMDYCREKGVKVTSAPFGNIVSVAEYAVLMLLQCAKNTYAVEKLWRSPANDYNSRNTHCGHEVECRTLGVVGTGKIGSLVAKKAMYGLDMNIVAYDPYLPWERRASGAEYVQSIDELMERSDYVTLHVPLNTNTKGLIGEAELRCMRRSAYLINSSRGEIVDEQALIAILRDGGIAGAALDVYTSEPFYPSPLFDMPNVIVSPHIAGMTRESADRVGIHAAAGIDDVLSGREPQWPVDAAVGYAASRS